MNNMIGKLSNYPIESIDTCAIESYLTLLDFQL